MQNITTTILRYLLSRRGSMTSAFGVVSIPCRERPFAPDVGVDGFASDGDLLFSPAEPLTRRCTLLRNPFIPTRESGEKPFQIVSRAQKQNSRGQ